MKDSRQGQGNMVCRVERPARLSKLPATWRDQELKELKSDLNMDFRTLQKAGRIQKHDSRLYTEFGRAF